MAEDELSYDVYVDQLKEVFNSCDEKENGFINYIEFDKLCEKLHLSDKKESLLVRINSQEVKQEIYFEDFKNVFLDLLQENYDGDEKDISGEIVSPGVVHASPKLIFSGKRYGRRTKPENNISDTELTLSLNNSHNVSLEQRVSEAIKKLNHTLSTDVEDDEELNFQRSQTYSVPANENEDDHADQTFESEGPLDVSGSEVGMEKLHEIWTELGVGQDGYLSQEGLSQVCNHIGMKGMTEEEIQDIFVNLDSDKDGKVSYNEFIRGFLHHTSNNQKQHLSPISRVPQSVTKLRRTATYKIDDSSKGPSVIADGGAAGLFSAIDTNNTGFAKPSDIIDLWERVGITNGLDILMTLGFEIDCRVNLAELSFDLERELLANNNSDLLYQAALATYQQEIKHLRVQLDNVTGERDKLRLDLTEANSRNILMAKEVDERHASIEKSAETKLLTLEKKYSEQIRSLQSTLEEERETHSSVSTQLHKKLEEHKQTTRYEESILREKLQQAEQEIKRLEEDRAETVKRLGEAEKMINRLQKELNTTGELRQKLSEYERVGNTETEEYRKFAEEKWKQYESENKRLKDRNDELTAEVENMNHRLAVDRRKLRHSTGGRSTRIPVREGSQLSTRRKQSLQSLSSTEIEDDDPVNKDVNILTYTGLPSPDGEPNKMASMEKELRENREYLEREKKEIQHAYLLEIAELEEKHLAEKAELLRNIEEAKTKDQEMFNRAKEEYGSQVQMELQTSFAMEKQDLVLKHESEKNHLEHVAAEERRKLTEKLKEEFDRDVTSKMIELKNEFNTERSKLEISNRDQQITIQSLNRRITEVDLKMKLQEEELALQFDQERQEMKERHKLEIKQMEIDHNREVQQHQNMLNGGVENLEGKLKDDFYALLAQQKEEELLLDRSTMLNHIQQNNIAQSSLLEEERLKLSAEMEKEKAEIIDKYEREIESLKLDMQNLSARIEEEKRDMKERHSLEKQHLEENITQSLREEIEEEYNQQIDNLKKTFEGEQDSLEVRNRISEEEILFLQKELAKKEEQLGLMTELKENFERKLEDMTKTKEDLEKRIDELIADTDNTIAAVKSEHLDALKQIEVLKETMNQNDRKEQLEEELKELHQQFQLSNQQNQQLENEISHFKTMEEDQANKLEDMHKELQTMSNENTQLKSEIDRLRKNELDQDERITFLEQELQVVTDEDAQLKDLTDQLSTLKTQLEDKLHLLENQLQQSVQQNQKLKNDIDQLLQNETDFVDKIRLLEKEVQSKTDENIHLETVCDDVTAEKAALVAQITKLNEDVALQQKKANMILDADVLKPDVIQKEVVESRLQSVFEQVNMAASRQEESLTSEDKENQSRTANEKRELGNLSEDLKLKMLQEDLKQMTHRKDEYKRLAENLKKQIHDIDKLRHQNDKEQVTSLQREKKKLEDILKATSDQRSWLRSMTEDMRLFEASTELAKSQYKYVNEIQSWKEKTTNVVDIENYTKVQLNLFEQQRLVLLLQEALRNQNEATEKLHKDMVQAHNKSMSIAVEDKQRLSQKLKHYKASFIEINEKYCKLLRDNQKLCSDNSKLAQTLNQSTKNELLSSKKCEQLEHLAKNLRSLLTKNTP